MITIDGKTQLVGLIGWPVSHTFSPAMQNAAAAAAGLNWVYVPMPVHPDDVETAVLGLPALGFRGVNVTVPHKQAVIPCLDALDAGAQAIGAVNTIVVKKSVGDEDQGDACEEARLVGFNTDWSGFLADLRAHGVNVNGRDCLILGAGGSARAIAYALSTVGGRVSILARRMKQAEELVTRLRPYFVDGLLQAAALAALPTVVNTLNAPLIVNSTPVGMSPEADRSPWPDALPFPAGAFVYDLIYNPLQTKLMQQAQASGCHAANGLGMLVYQGAKAFHLWSGIQPDVTVMREAIRKSSESGG